MPFFEYPSHSLRSQDSTRISSIFSVQWNIALLCHSTLRQKSFSHNEKVLSHLIRCVWNRFLPYEQIKNVKTTESIHVCVPMELSYSLCHGVTRYYEEERIFFASWSFHGKLSEKTHPQYDWRYISCFSVYVTDRSKPFFFRNGIVRKSTPYFSPYFCQSSKSFVRSLWGEIVKVVV